MDEHDIDKHPDLVDPDWQRRAERAARLEVRRERRRATRGKRFAWAAVGVAVLLAAGVAFYRWGKTTSDHYDANSPGNATTTQPASAVTRPAPSVLPEVSPVDLSRPFDPNGRGPIMSPSDIDAFTRTSADFTVVFGPPSGKNDAGLWLGQTSGLVYSNACQPFKAGYLAPYYSEREYGAGSRPTDEAAIFDVNQPWPQTKNADSGGAGADGRERSAPPRRAAGVAHRRD